MGVTVDAQPAARVEQHDASAKLIVFFDVETNVPGRACRSYELLEFGAVVLEARGLGELRSFHTLIRPTDLSCVDRRTTDCNTITPATLALAPCFQDVAHDIYQLLHGHIWAGHNILRFDILRINEAFSKIGQPAPQPAGVVDTYPLLRKTFGKRAGNYKLSTLANYCGFGKQEHRSIADVRMNIDVLRSCATMLFLESNYPDIFVAQMELSTSTSWLEQSASFSTSYPQNNFLGNDHGEQEVDSQIRCPNEAGDMSSASRPSALSKNRFFSGVDSSSEGLKEILSLRRSGLSCASLDLKLGDSNTTGKENCGSLEGQANSSFCRAVMEDEECVSSKPLEASSVLRSDHAQEEVLTGFENVSKNASAVEGVDIKSVNVETSMHFIHADEELSLYESTTNVSAMEDRVGNELDLLHNFYSVSLVRDLQDETASDKTLSKVESSSIAELSKLCSIPEFEGIPFLLATHVSLPSIEVREEPSSHGSRKTLYYNGFPLHLLEFKIKVRFTVNMSYAFDDKGKPRFSVLIEPSETACNIIRKCEDMVKSMTATDSEVEWLPTLKKEFECWVARMSIGTKWMGSFATYTTEFFRATADGLEKISLGHVDAMTFRDVLPHGSIVDTGFGFYVFNVKNRTGVRLLAKHITLS